MADEDDQGPPRYLTRKALAHQLSVSEKTIGRWQKEGMPAEHWGSQIVRFRLDRVEEWLAEQSNRT